MFRSTMINLTGLLLGCATFYVILVGIGTFSHVKTDVKNYMATIRVKL